MATNPHNVYTFRTNGNKTIIIKPKAWVLTFLLGILGRAGGNCSHIQYTWKSNAFFNA